MSMIKTQLSLTTPGLHQFRKVSFSRPRLPAAKVLSAINNCVFHTEPSHSPAQGLSHLQVTVVFIAVLRVIIASILDYSSLLASAHAPPWSC
eukprot:4634861-Amphidinium_carterae.1